MAVTTTYYVQAGGVTWAAVVCAAAIGLLAANILVANNYRDAETDLVAGKNIGSSLRPKVCRCSVRRIGGSSLGKPAALIELGLSRVSLVAVGAGAMGLSSDAAFGRFADSS